MKGKNPATKRTEEELNLFYKEYCEGETLKKLSTKYNTDCGHQFKINNFKTRKTSDTKILRQKLDLQIYYNQYSYTFDKISNEIEAYIIGLFYADGFVSNSQAGIKLHINDLELMNIIKNYISKDIILQVKNNICGFAISGEDILNNMVSLGCLKQKTYKKLFIPKINTSLLRHFIRGYFDGDGTIYKDGKYLKANICGINEEFLKDLQNLLLESNIFSTINIEIREGKTMKTPQGFSNNCKNMYRLFIRKKEDFKKFYDFMYKDSTIFLKRKKLKFNEGNYKIT